MNKEPIGIVALVVAFVAIVIEGVGEFGIDLTDAQQSVLNKALLAAAAIATWWLARKHTFSERTVGQIDPAALNDHKAA